MNPNDTTTDLEDIQTTADVADETASSVEVDSQPTEGKDQKALTLNDAVAKAFAKHVTDDSSLPTKALPASKPALEVPEGKVVDPVTGRVSEPPKAPAGWTPTLREKWSAVDPTVQKFIKDQEAHISRTLQEASDAKKFQAEFKDIAQPYEALFREYRTDAKSVARDLFTQWSALTTGSPQRRAELLHGLIMHFQPDFAVLSHLAQNAPRQPMTAAPVPQKQVDVQAEVTRILAERESNALSQRTSSAIQAFADEGHEFYVDVKDMMSKVLLAGLIQGNSEAEVLKNAYEFACQQHPEVKATLAARQAAAPAPAPVASRTTKPVGSVKPSLGAGNKSATPAKRLSVADAATEAMRRHGLLT